MERNDKNNFGEGSIPKIIISMAIPMLIAEIVNALYSVVDRMFIGHIPEVGKYALTGLGLTVPIITTVAAFGSLCGAGGGPLCSIARGKNDNDEAELVMGNAFTMLIAFAVILTAVGLLLLEPLLNLLGASDQTFPYAYGYMRIYISGTLFSIISFGMNFFINSQGFAKMGMMTITIGAVVNLILDPIFIFALKLGIEGAAIATVIAQFVSALWVMLFIMGKKTILKLRLKAMRPNLRVVKEILSLGASGFIMKATTGMVQVLYNTQLKRYGGDLYIGSMTIVNSVREILIMVFHGINSGSQPVLGFNYGAGKYERVKKGIRVSTCLALGYAAVVWVLSMVFAREMASVFTGDEELVALCTKTLRLFFSCFIFKALQLTGQNVYIAIGKGKYAIFFSVLRKIIVVTPLIFILPAIPQLGADGVFIADAVADVVCSLSCYLFMYYAVYKKVLSNREACRVA